MNKRKLTLYTEFGDLSLRSIEKKDQENLRNWKNQNRQFFFFKDLISLVDQMKWFSEYLKRLDDYIFVVSIHMQDIGCLGFRLSNGDEIDIYNVILGLPSMGKKGFMSQSIRMMCSFVLQEYSHPITLKVLLDNPAYDWYVRQGFRNVSVHDIYRKLELDIDAFKPCQIGIISNAKPIVSESGGD